MLLCSLRLLLNFSSSTNVLLHALQPTQPPAEGTIFRFLVKSYTFRLTVENDRNNQMSAQPKRNCVRVHAEERFRRFIEDIGKPSEGSYRHQGCVLQNIVGNQKCYGERHGGRTYFLEVPTEAEQVLIAFMIINSASTRT